MGLGKFTLVAAAIIGLNVFLASLVGLMMGGVPGAIGGVLVGLCISVPMLPRQK
jgi:hypothetical protein